MQQSYFIINKPFGMLSQFRKEAEHHRTLGELHQFPSDVYPVGRLDKDSEGLLILTNDSRLNAQLLRPEAGHLRTYWVQVEGIPTSEAINQLNKGVNIRVDKRQYLTRPAKARLMEELLTSDSLSLPIRPAGVQERNPPIRFRKTVPDCWIELQLTEGKNRQVRRMCAAIGYPVLRLVRSAIGHLTIADLRHEAVQEVEWGWLKKRIFV